MSAYGYSTFLKTQVDASFVEVKAETTSLRGQLDASFVALKTENAALKGQLDASFVALQTEVNSGGGADTTALDASMTYVLNWINDNTDNLTTQVDEAINEKITTTLVEEYVARLDVSDSALNQNIAQAVTDKEGQIESINNTLSIFYNTISNIQSYLKVFSPTYTLVDEYGNEIVYADNYMEGVTFADPAEIPNNSGVAGGVVDNPNLPQYINIQAQTYQSETTMTDGTNTFTYDFENNAVSFEGTYYYLVEGAVDASSAGGDTVSGIKYVNYGFEPSQYIIFQQSNEEGLSVLEVTSNFSNNGIVAYSGDVFTVSGGGGGSSSLPAYITAQSYTGIETMTDGTNTFQYDFENNQVILEVNLVTTYYNLVEGAVDASSAGGDTVSGIKYENSEDTTQYIIFQQSNEEGLTVLEATLDFSNNGIVAYGGEFTVSGGGGGGGGEETQQVPAYLESEMGVNGATLTTASFTSGTNTFDISYDDMSSEWQLWLSGVKYQLGFDTAGRSRFFQETDSTYYIVFDATEPGGLKVLDYANVTNFALDETYTIVQ